MPVSRSQVEWLRALISDHENALDAIHRYDEGYNEDPEATDEMLAECKALADQLDMKVDYSTEIPESLPTFEEVNAMARKAGYDEIPF